MIKQIKIFGFKCFLEENIDLATLTVVTGPNSSGKSSLLQALLLVLNNGAKGFGVYGADSDTRLCMINLKSKTQVKVPLNDQYYTEIDQYLASLGNFTDLSNKNIAQTSNIKHSDINITMTNSHNVQVTYNMNMDNVRSLHYDSLQCCESIEYVPIEFSYLNANRMPVNDIQYKPLGSTELNIDSSNILEFFMAHKRQVLDRSLDYNSRNLEYGSPISNFLEDHVNYWLKYITNQDISFQVEKLNTTSYKAFYKIDGQDSYKPINLGAGVNYLIAILTQALLMEPNAVLIVENPELHLHPQSQAKVGEFFAFIASTGRQIIIETQSEHLINKLRYCVYKKMIDSSQVVIQYRDDNKFEKIDILQNGSIRNEYGLDTFPTGFFDATLDNLLEVNANG